MVKRLRIPSGDLIAVDTETTGLDVYHGDRIFAIAFCNEEGDTECIEWDVDPVTRAVHPNAADLPLLKDFLADRAIAKVFHNANFDVGMFEVGLGMQVRGTIHDTLIAIDCLNSAEPKRGLKPLAEKYLDAKREDVDALHAATIQARREARRRGWRLGPAVEADYWLDRHLNPDSELCREYAAYDVQCTILLHRMFHEAFEKYDCSEAYALEMQLFRLLLKMERRGLWIDLEVNFDELKRHKRQAQRALSTLRRLADDPKFNPNSTRQVIRLLHEELGLPITESTPGGDPKTSQDVLAVHQSEPVVRALLDYRANTKAVTSFFTAFHAKAVPDHRGDGYCIHPRFRQSGKRTGRLSCASPNLQGVADAESSRSESPISARTPFGPRDGYVWLAADYSQLEARIFAAAADEPLLIEAFASGRDLHTETTNRAWGGRDNPRAIEAAKRLLGIDSDRKADRWLASFDHDIVAAEASLGTKTLRACGKTIFFSRVMGGGYRSIMRKLHCSREEAQEFIRAFDAAVPGIRAFLKRCERQAHRDGFIETLFGRKLQMLPDDCWKAGQYLVQGSAADLIKRRMLALQQYFERNEFDTHLVLQVHDELIFEIRRDLFTGRLVRKIQRIMEDNGGAICIALPVGMNLIRKRWAEKTKLDVDELPDGPILVRRPLVK